MEVTTTFAASRALATGRVGLVPTMGYLHEGHLSLITLARSANDTVMMSLFVNPRQFGDGGDLARYPRDLERDAALAEEAGVDILFAPDEDEVYPRGDATTVTVTGLTDTLEGTHRPGHFAGVTTVVTRLLGGLGPDRAYFGRKDAQQLAVVRRMVEDLRFPVEIVGAPIVRDQDGIALSSRNVFLDAAGRASARALSEGLMAAADAVEAGERSTDVIEAVAWEHLTVTGGLIPEYAAVATVASLSRPETLTDASFLAVAGRVGKIRLIDNVHLDPDVGSSGFTADRGVRLTSPTLLEV